MRAHDALSIVLATWCVACDAVLGIHDVPNPNGGSDVHDAYVDVPPLPSCGSGYACTAVTPVGWTGPIAFAAAAGSSIPTGCSGSYGSAGPVGHDGLSASPASCTCTCPTSSTGTTCGGPALDVYSGTACNNKIYGATLTPGVCSSDFSGAGSVNAYEGSPTSLGSCTPAFGKTLPAVGWQVSYAACEYTGASDGGGCSAGTVCVESPSSAFASKPCILQTGDVACPGAPYTQKTLLTTGTTDTRDCTTCVCTPAGGSCSATITVYTGSGCGSGALAPYAADGTCGAQGVSAVSAIASTPIVTAASCTQSGGQATGTVTTTSPVTVCCQL